MSNLYRVILLIAICFLGQIKAYSQVKQQRSDDLILWYDKPATNWMTEALPIGNGYLGIMFFGDANEEQIQFSEGSLWAGGKNANPKYNSGVKEKAYEYLPKVRSLIAEGKFTEAHTLAKAELTGQINENPKHASNSDYGAQQTMGDIFVQVSQEGEVKNYKRSLNISNATANVSYETNQNKYTRTFYGNYPSKVMVYKFTSAKPETYTIKYKTPHDKQYENFSNNQYTFGGNLKDNRQEFETAYKVNTDGKVSYQNGILTITNAKSVILLHTASTDYLPVFPEYKGNDYKKFNVSALSAATKKTESQLYQEHQKDYKNLFGRVSLHLGNTTNKHLPTDQRQIQFFNGNSDPEFEVLYFQYGRYLMISSTRPGTMPMSLQGKWNNSTNPPWTNDYHTNINIQMLYWPAEVTNLSECYLPLSEFTESLIKPGQLAAKEFFNTRGWVVNTMLNAYGYTSPGWDLPWGFFPGGAAWLAQHMWEHYAFTSDLNYLKNQAYPVMKEASLFWIDYLSKDQNGHLVSNPSYSPEHGGISSGATMDHQLAWDVLTNTIEAAEILKINDSFIKDAKRVKSNILPLKIGKWGQLQEWNEDVDDSTSKHRHVSHLFGLHPGKQISIIQTPTEAEAARVSLNARGDDGTGWSLAWKVNFWARLQEGDRAYKLYKSVMRPVNQTADNYMNGGGSYANLLCAHPPFQLDGNMGSTAGIAEMLLQSQTGVIEVLPAMPSTWLNGHVSGLKARGNVTVDIAWNQGDLNQIILKSASTQRKSIRYKNKTIEVKLVKNTPYIINMKSFE